MLKCRDDGNGSYSHGDGGADEERSRQTLYKPGAERTHDHRCHRAAREQQTDGRRREPVLIEEQDEEGASGIADEEHQECQHEGGTQAGTLQKRGRAGIAEGHSAGQRLLYGGVFAGARWRGIVYGDVAGDQHDPHTEQGVEREGAFLLLRDKRLHAQPMPSCAMPPVIWAMSNVGSVKLTK